MAQRERPADGRYGHDDEGKDSSSGETTAAGGLDAVERIAQLEEEVRALREEKAELKQALEDVKTQQWQWLRVTSPLTDEQHWKRFPEELYEGRSWYPERWRWWQSWCPCCRRPLDISLFRGDYVAPAPASPSQVSEVAWAASESSANKERFAYAATLWGASEGFALGALTLGAALRRSGTEHDLVLMHTDDVPASTRSLLEKVWTLKPVELILGDSSLFTMAGLRFSGVFTKLQALALTDYSKVLLLDLDLAVLKCPDDLFELPTPAAMHRTVYGARHGAAIDGRRFFAPESLEPDSDAYPWGQCSGINAGVMLLRPDADLHAKVVREVRLPFHPERIPGNGPEQDYLSRLFAPHWTNISVAYNYQLHRVFHALEAALRNSDPDFSWWPDRLRLCLDDISLVHFSGDMKLWDYDPKAEEERDDFAERMLVDCASYYYRLFIELDGSDEDYAAYEIRKTADGNLEYLREDAETAGAASVLVDHAVGLARAAAQRATAQWWQDCESLHTQFPELPPMKELRRILSCPEWPENVAFAYQQRVEIWWRHAWYPATVMAAHQDGSFSVVFDEGGHWGSGARAWPHSLRVLTPENGS